MARDDFQPPPNCIRAESCQLSVSLRNDAEKMKLENLLYIDKAGAWAVVAFTVVAGVMVFDTAHCLSKSPARDQKSQPQASQPAVTFVTNHFSRVVTNVIEVRIPVNVFHNEYRTSRIEQFSTNFVDVYRTNAMTQFITNIVEIDPSPRPPGPSTSPGQPVKLQKPVPIPNPRVIGRAQRSSIELVRADKPFRNTQRQRHL